MSNDKIPITPEEFSGLLNSECLRVLADQTSLVWENAADPEEIAEDSEFDFRADIALSGELNGRLQIRVAAPYVLVLASALLGRACDDMGEAEGEAIRNLCQATIEGLCVADAAKLGAVESVSKISSDVLPSEHVSRLTLANPDGSEVGFEVRLTQELVLSLSRKEPEPPAIDTEEAMPEAFAEQEADVATPVTHHLPFELNGRTFRDPVESANLDLVLDVELNVTLRFGQRQLSLREVLELTSGSVVELDRQVEEPVELLLDGKVIARGEAVVIDGNYGMRITEVPQQFIPTALR